MRPRYILPAIATTLIMALPGGCRHKDLSPDTEDPGYVKVVYDWGKAPEAFPDGMTLWMYHDSGRSYRIELPGREGGISKVYAGNHAVISCNSDTEITCFTNIEAFDTHYAQTFETDVFRSVRSGENALFAPRAHGAENERVVAPPDQLWSARTGNVKVTVGKTTVVTLEPEPMTCHYFVEIRGVTNLGDVETMCGSLTGMSPGVRLSDGELSDEPVTVPFAMTADLERGVITGEFLTFGHHPANGSAHRLVLYVWLRDGSRLCYGTEGSQFDVTSQIDDAPDSGNVNIVIEGLDLPAGFTDGTFQPGVSDWLEIDTDILI